MANLSDFNRRIDGKTYCAGWSVRMILKYYIFSLIDLELLAVTMLPVMRMV